jgi:hypothetical protein
VSIDVPTAKVELASGKPVKVTKEASKAIKEIFVRGKDVQVFTLDLDVADVLILR